MAESKVIVVTGASRGIGHAIAKYLISLPQHHRLVITARSADPLKVLREQAPDRVEITTGDFAQLTTARNAIDVAITKFGRLDGLILNHGTLSEVERVANSNIDGWIDTFRVNFFSVIEAIKAAIPHLRQSKGRIILTSSGAASNFYATWGAYGSSKAALNHLAGTLSVEEPDITTISIRPGVVDSQMQQDIREKHATNMDEKDRNKFISSHREGKLLKPEQPGNVIARLAIEANKDLTGRYLSWDDQSLAAYQDSASGTNTSA